MVAEYLEELEVVTGVAIRIRASNNEDDDAQGVLGPTRDWELGWIAVYY